MRTDTASIGTRSICEAPFASRAVISPRVTVPAPEQNVLRPPSSTHPSPAATTRTPSAGAVFQTPKRKPRCGFAVRGRALGVPFRTAKSRRRVSCPSMSRPRTRSRYPIARRSSSSATVPQPARRARQPRHCPTAVDRKASPPQYDRRGRRPRIASNDLLCVDKRQLPLAKFEPIEVGLATPALGNNLAWQNGKATKRSDVVRTPA